MLLLAPLLQDFFAWRWRATLTARLQQLYCNSAGAMSSSSGSSSKTRRPLLQVSPVTSVR